MNVVHRSSVHQPPAISAVVDTVGLAAPLRAAPVRLVAMGCGGAVVPLLLCWWGNAGYIGRLQADHPANYKARGSTAGERKTTELPPPPFAVCIHIKPTRLTS